jgi:hypothetical protein
MIMWTSFSQRLYHHLPKYWPFLLNHPVYLSTLGQFGCVCSRSSRSIRSSHENFVVKSLRCQYRSQVSWISWDSVRVTVHSSQTISSITHLHTLREVV